MPTILQNTNWIDVLFVILLLGMVYKGTRSGVADQIVSLVGAFVLLFASISSYNFLSEALFGFLLQKWTKPVSFLFVAVMVFIIVKVLERVFHLMGGEELARIERIGGALMAALRGAVLCGVLGIFFLLVPTDYMKTATTEGSRTCMQFVKLDVQLYVWMKNIIMPNMKDSDKKPIDEDDVLKEILESS